MVKLYDGGVYLVNGTEIVTDPAALPSLCGKSVTKEEAQKGTIAYGILKAHNQSGDMQNLRNTLEQVEQQVFDEVVQRLLNANAVYVMGLRSAAPLAQFMGYYLNYIFDNVHLVSSGATDVFEEIIKLRENDVLIGISFPRYSTRTLEAMRFAKRCGAQVVAITDGPMSPLAEIADLSLTARTDMASFVDSIAAPLSLINALLVTLGLHRKQALSQHFKQLESIWETYEVYLEEEGHGDVRS